MAVGLVRSKGMRSISRSGLAVLVLFSSACGNGFTGSKDAAKEGETSGGSSGDAGAGVGGEAGAEGGTGGTPGGSAGSGKGGSGGTDDGGRAGSGNGGTSGSAGSTGATGGTAGTTGGTAGGAGTPSCTLADSWQTIGDFQLAAGQHSNPATVVAAPPNRLYAVGIARMGTFQWVVRRSNDGGATWERVDGEGMSGGASDVVVDMAGTVFVVGNTDAGRIVRRSTDNGDSWMTVDTIPGGTGNDPCNAGYLAVTPNGNVYVAAGCDSTGVIVRRSTDGGDTWNQVDGFRYTTTAQTRMGTLGVDATQQVYVGGYGVEPGGSVHWLVRRGTGTGTWTTVDDFQLVNGGEASVANFGGTSAIYAAGYAIDADGAAHWIVRRAQYDDQRFTTVDDVGPIQNMERLAAHSVFQASSGAFVAAGSSAVGSSPGRVVYRRSADGEAWSPAGDFAYVSGQDSSPAGRITQDAAGNLYGMVRGVGADGFAHWILRRLSCN